MFILVLDYDKAWVDSVVKILELLGHRVAVYRGSYVPNADLIILGTITEAWLGTVPESAYHKTALALRDAADLAQESLLGMGFCFVGEKPVGQDDVLRFVEQASAKLRREK